MNMEYNNNDKIIEHIERKIDSFSVYKLDETNCYIPLSIYNRYFNLRKSLKPSVINIEDKYYAFVTNKVLDAIINRMNQNHIDPNTVTEDFFQIYSSKSNNKYISKYIYDKYYYGEKEENNESVTINGAKYYSVSQSIIDRIIVSNPNLKHKEASIPMLDLFSNKMIVELENNITMEKNVMQNIRSDINILLQENKKLKEEIVVKDKLITDLINKVLIKAGITQEEINKIIKSDQEDKNYNPKHK